MRSVKRVLITGGAGFIGSHLAGRLIDTGYAVTLFDNMTTGQPNLIDPKAEFIRGDVSNPRDVGNIPPSDIVAVFHLAAQSSGEISFDNPHADFQTNAGGTILLLQWCKEHSIRRFLYTSSMAVYGMNSDIPLKEDIPCVPKSFYGVAKLASEHYIRMYSSLGMDSTILRLFNVYGSKQNIQNMKQGMASIYLSYLLQGGPINVKGSFDRFRDQTHVADVVDAMMLCLESSVSLGKTYNVATGNKTTVKHLIDMMIKVSGKPANEIIIKTLDGTPGDLFGCYADVSYIFKDLGWTCRHTLESGLREMYDYFERRSTHAQC